MLCEVIAYILSRQRLSAKTFVTGCVFYALQDRFSLWMLCDTAGVGGFPLHFSTGSPFGHHPRLRMVCPLWGQWMSTWRRFACLYSCISCIVCRHSHHLSSSAASTQRYSRLWQRRTAGIEQPHKSTLASGGGAPCLTAGDARRVNPWRRG